MKILTAAQMNMVDRQTTELYGIPSLTLMENAGFHLFHALDQAFEDLAERNILIVCGKGNNGGDGLVLARQLIQRRIPPQVVLLGETSAVRGDAAVNLNILLKAGYPLLEVTDEEAWNIVAQRLDSFDIIVDAILGTGISKPLSGLYRDVVRDINQTDAFILAVDIPSGMVSDAVEAAPEQIWADLTVTFTAPKIAQVLSRDLEAVGDLIVAPIGTPDDVLEKPEHDLNLITRETAALTVYPRLVDAHKGTFGHVVLVAGSRGKAGAAGLTSLAALRTGSGLVTAVVPAVIQDLVASYHTEVMTEGIASTPTGTFAKSGLHHILGILEGKDACGIGPGLTTEPETAEVVKEIVRQSPVPRILDADALNAFAGSTHELTNFRKRPLILTPHPGEFSRLTGIPTAQLLTEQLRLTKEFARSLGVWVVLKTHRTLIATPTGQIFVSPRGNPGMATAGMGDVLTGVLTSLIGQAAAGDSFEETDITAALCTGVYLHGQAGDLAMVSQGEESLTAGDVIGNLGESYRRITGY